MTDSRGKLEAEDLLKLVLVLVAVWLVLAIVGELLSFLGWILGPLQPILGFVVLLLIVLWLLDRI